MVHCGWLVLLGQVVGEAIVSCDLEARFCGGIVAYVCGDDVVDVDGCGGGCEVLGSMSVLVFTLRSSYVLDGRGRVKRGWLIIKIERVGDKLIIIRHDILF